MKNLEQITTKQEQNNKHDEKCPACNAVKAAGLVGASVALIFTGFLLDGITEYGHHACFIIGGMLIGLGIGKLKQ